MIFYLGKDILLIIYQFPERIFEKTSTNWFNKSKQEYSTNYSFESVPIFLQIALFLPIIPFLRIAGTLFAILLCAFSFDKSVYKLGYNVIYM